MGQGDQLSPLVTQAKPGAIRSHDLIVVDAYGKRENRRVPGAPHSHFASRRDSKVATPYAPSLPIDVFVIHPAVKRNAPLRKMVVVHTPVAP